MRILILQILLLSSITSISQSIANYTTARTTGITYSSIVSTGSAVNSWRNVTPPFEQDDNRSYFINIGFDFWYNGVRYTQLAVSTNGYLDFSSSTDDGGPVADDFGYNNAAFSASTASVSTRPACAVFYDDLTAQGGSAPLGNSIRYLLAGTAPNRTLTLEWINMAVYTNTTPSLNFQVKLYENTGKIAFDYGTMNTGTFTFSYTLGINATNVSAPPLASELKNQTTANTNTFSNTPQNNLSTLPSTNSQISFTPPVPANPSGALTFSAITQTSMTLNFLNWATNEIGYVIYSSTDGVNYSFVAQTAVNATSQNVTGLLPGTTYYWKVLAVTEGALSTALTGTQATLPAGNKVSNVAAGNWNNAASWLPVGVPTATDNVTILNGHTITINSDVNCNRLTVGQGISGTLTLGNNNTTRTLNIGENIIVNTGANFSVNTASNTTHLIPAFTGSITNNGTFNFATDANSLCDIAFTKNGNQTLLGTGATTNFNLVTLNMGSSENNVLTVSAANFTAPANFIILQNGTFKLQSSNTATFNLLTTVTTVGPTSGLWFGNANATINFPSGLTLEGNLRLDAGIMAIGDAANENLTSNGGELYIAGGTFRVAGRYFSSGINNLSRFQMTGGTMTVPFVSSTSTTIEPFSITSAGSVVIISGGTIIIQNEGGTGAQNLGYRIANVINSSVTGGVLQIGNTTTAAAQTMLINTILPVGNLLVNSNNATAQLGAALTVRSNVTITTGTLNNSTFNLTVGGNWLDNATFNPGTSAVIFNGSALQTITKATTERFNDLFLSSTDTVKLSANIDVDRNMIINPGSKFSAGTLSKQVDIQGNLTNSGYINARKGLFLFNGVVLQTISSTLTTRFYNLQVNNAAGVRINTGIFELQGAYTPTVGNFNVTLATSFTMLSDALTTSRIAQAGTGQLPEILMYSVTLVRARQDILIYLARLLQQQ